MKTQKDNQLTDTQGEFLGMPYDFRRPSKQKILSRIWNDDGPLFPAKTWGMGWTINLKHPKAPLLLVSMVALLAALLAS